MSLELLSWCLVFSRVVIFLCLIFLFWESHVNSDRTTDLLVSYWGQLVPKSFCLTLDLHKRSSCMYHLCDWYLDLHWTLMTVLVGWGTSHLHFFDSSAWIDPLQAFVSIPVAPRPELTSISSLKIPWRACLSWPPLWHIKSMTSMPELTSIINVAQNPLTNLPDLISFMILLEVQWCPCLNLSPVSIYVT